MMTSRGRSERNSDQDPNGGGGDEKQEGENLAAVQLPSPILSRPLTTAAS